MVRSVLGSGRKNPGARVVGEAVDLLHSEFEWDSTTGRWVARTKREEKQHPKAS